MLSLAATVEQRSEHPLGVPVVAEVRRRGIALSESPLSEFHSHTGHGVHARVDGIWVGVGREGLFETHDIAIPAELIEQAQRIRERGQTALLVLTVEESLCGVIGVADQIRPEATATMDALKRLGIRKIVILTGDHERVAQAIAKLLHADEVRAGLLPDQKVVELRRLAENGGLVAMVGDGVNDAPALAAAQRGNRHGRCRYRCRPRSCRCGADARRPACTAAGRLDQPLGAKTSSPEYDLRLFDDRSARHFDIL